MVGVTLMIVFCVIIPCEIISSFRRLGGQCFLCNWHISSSKSLQHPPEPNLVTWGWRLRVTPRSRNKLIILDSVITQNAIIWLATFPSLRLLCSAAKIAETLLITVKDGNCILFCVKPAEQWSQQKLELLVRDIICMVLSASEWVKLRISFTRDCVRYKTQIPIRFGRKARSSFSAICAQNAWRVRERFVYFRHYHETP